MTRKQNDAYYTVDAVAERCVAKLFHYLPGNSLVGLEPSYGGGSFVRAIEKIAFNEQRRVSVDGVDIATHRSMTLILSPESKFEFNSIEADTKAYKFRRPYDFIVGNPPYNEAEAHLLMMFSEVERLGVNCTAGFLLRCGFRHTKKRKFLFDKHPVHSVHAIRRRPSFTGDGRTDGTEYDFIVWRYHNGMWLTHPEYISWID